MTPALAVSPSRQRHRRWWTRLAVLGLAGLALGLAPTASAQSARYQIDPEHFSVGFLVDHISYAKVLGLFRKATGSFSFDEKTGALSDVRIEIDTRSVDTNHALRDDHLRGPDFLDVAKHPKMVFTAAEASREGERDFVLAGQLQLIGRTRPVTIRARWNKSAVYEIGTFRKPYVMGVSARGSFKRSDFAMMYAVDNGWVGDEVELILEFEARRD